MTETTSITWPTLPSHLSALLDDLTSYRDTFYAVHERSTWPQRVELLTKRAQLLINDCRLASSDPTSQLHNQLFIGGVWSIVAPVNTTVVEKALTHLNKCVAMRPECACAWHAIGDAQMAAERVRLALDAYRSAVKHERSSRSLRALSPLVRKTADRTDTKLWMASLRESIALAEEARNLDDTNADSWYVLGNANFSFFFATSQHDKKYLNEALFAFEKATSCSRGFRCAELYYNYGEALRFGQSYAEAVEQYEIAEKTDPTLKEATEQRTNLVEFTSRVNSAVAKKGTLRGRKLRDALAHLSTIYNTPTHAMWGSASSCPKGPICVPVDLAQIEFDNVTPSTTRRLPLFVTAMCLNEQSVPFTCICIDRNNDCTAVCVYNCASDFGLVVGTTIVVDLALVVKKHIVMNNVDYPCIRVGSPDALTVNGTRVDSSKRALTTLAFNIVA